MNTSHVQECVMCEATLELCSLCCDSGLIACVKCVLNGQVNPQTQCSVCHRQMGKKLKKIISEVLESNSKIRTDKRNSMSSSMIQTQKKQSQGLRKKQEVPNLGMYPGPYQNCNYPPNYMPQNNQYPPMPYYPINYPGWQPNYFYGHQMAPQMPNPMMNYYGPQQQPVQTQWMNMYIPPGNDQNQQKPANCPNMTNPELERSTLYKMFKSAQRGLPIPSPRNPSFKDNDPEEMPRNLYRGQTHSRAFQHQSKTTDYLEQVSQNKTVSLNRSSSVNNMTLRR